MFWSADRRLGRIRRYEPEQLRTLLVKAGFEQVFNLHGGLQEWERAGQPVSRKRK